MINQLKKTICNNLFKIRTVRNYSQRYIGQVLSISQPAYKKMEDGTTIINASQLGVLADFYDLPIEFFYRQYAVFSADSYRTRTQYEQLHEQLNRSNLLLDVYHKRITELEAKVVRKDAKIEELYKLITRGYQRHNQSLP